MSVRSGAGPQDRRDGSSLLPPHPLPPVIGPYAVGKILSRRTCVIAEVDDARTGMRCALKLLPRAHQWAREQFEVEMEVLASTDHPNVVGFLERGEERGLPFFTMELVEGQGLLTWIDAEPIVKAATPPVALTVEQQLRLSAPKRLDRIGRAMTQLGAALAALHARGRVYCNIDPDNVLVMADGHLKLLDFDLVRGVSRAIDNNEVERVQGNFAWQSPEQVQRGQVVDARTDLYLFGMLLYALLAGRHPFWDEHIDNPGSQSRRVSPPALTVPNPHAPRDWAALCVRLLQPDPALRPHTIHDVLRAINA